MKGGERLKGDLGGFYRWTCCAASDRSCACCLHALTRPLFEPTRVESAVHCAAARSHRHPPRRPLQLRHGLPSKACTARLQGRRPRDAPAPIRMRHRSLPRPEGTLHLAVRREGTLLPLESAHPACRKGRRAPCCERLFPTSVRRWCCHRHSQRLDVWCGDDDPTRHDRTTASRAAACVRLACRPRTSHAGSSAPL